MTADELRRSAAPPGGTQPPGLSGALLALWHDAGGDWHKAHEAAQADTSPAGSWVHAYLHRKEGDPGNAAYWYGRAGRPVSSLPLDREWESIAAGLLPKAG
jgi:hypothetical protein